MWTNLRFCAGTILEGLRKSTGVSFVICHLPRTSLIPIIVRDLPSAVDLNLGPP